MDFTHLHVHTEYSMLDGISRIPELVQHAAALNMHSLAITDHGTFHGVVDFYSTCRDAGIRPVIGCEMYVAHQGRRERGPAERSPHHLVLLARDNTGYSNLMELVTRSNTEGFYQKPRIDRELLEQHSAGLACLSGCPSSEVPRLLAQGDRDGAARAAGWHREIFGEHYYLELQEHRYIDNLEQINQGLLQLHAETGIPLVATNDAHYVHQRHAPLQDVYLRIQTGTTAKDEDRLRMEDDSYYIKSAEEMAHLFRDYDPHLARQALANTGRIAEGCEVSLDFGQTHLPRYDTPGSMDADQYLAQLCEEGFARRYGPDNAQARERLEYELGVIRYTSFANYFLVVWDIISFVRQQNILFGVRGSAAASVVLYCLGITSVDPLEYRLVFERFLNLERKEMPDIDMDFQDDRRDEVLHYVTNKYGNDRVAQIISFGTLGPKAALRDVGRAMGMAYPDVDRIARMVPLRAATLDKALAGSQELQAALASSTQNRELFQQAQGLEGIVHHVSTHAAGVLISDQPLTRTVPLQRPVKGDENSPVLMTQFSMDPVAQLGLLKMDFLGLTSLTILDQALALVNDSRLSEDPLDIESIPLDDPDTYALLASGNTTDVFQLESAGMQRYIEKLRPSNIGDIAAMIALYRPGPMENIDRFINSKHGQEEITYPHPSFRGMLDETYGVIVYQDQVLHILQQFAGYTLGAADIVRKAMGKKIPALMAQEREKFNAGAATKGYDEETATAIFDLIEPFAGYAFNKAHSVSYALISYWTAWFKTHHHTEYMAAVLNARRDNPDRVANSINECLRLGIKVLTPDVNRSGTLYTIDADEYGRPALRAGMASVKTVGEGAVAPLLADRRENGPYRSLAEFAVRAGSAGLNRRTLENLAKAGTFDSLAPRGAVLSSVDAITESAQRAAQLRNSGQSSLFGGAEAAAPEPELDLTRPDATRTEKSEWERELLGAPLTYNPLTALQQADTGDAITTASQIDSELAGQKVEVAGIVASYTERARRDGQKFLIVNLDMLGGRLEIMVWPEALNETRRVWQPGAMVLVHGTLRERAGSLNVSCDHAWPLDEPAEDEPQDGTQEHYGTQEYGPQEDYAEFQDERDGPTGDLDDDQDDEDQAGGPEDPDPQPEPQRNPGPAPQQRPPEPTRGPETPPLQLTLSLTESGDAQQDTMMLREALGVILEYPGQNQVLLSVRSPGRTTLMELPVVSTGYCEDMRLRLENVLGEDTVFVTVPG